MISRDAMLDGACRYCGAEPGVWCRSKTGRRARYLHADRWYTARDVALGGSS
jgi:hypothetical protein